MRPLRSFLFVLQCSLCTLAMFLIYTFSFKVTFLPNFINVLNIGKVNAEIRDSDAAISERRVTQPILTLFTTFKETSDRINIQTNTILNWASLGPLVQPVAFVNSSEEGILAKRAREHGWVVVPLLRTNKYGTPFLKDMYRAVPRLSNSTYYGYSNADILFDEGLVKTMVAMKRYVLDFNSSLLIGRRVNVNVNPSSTKPLYEGPEIRSLAKTKGRLFATNAEDYFMIGRIDRFPWHTIKDVVIGRPGYDNYLVGQAIKGKVAVIDATDTVLAFHQTGKDGIFAGAHNKDGHYNHHVIGGYNYRIGVTTAAQYVTALDARGDVFLQRRPEPKQKTKVHFISKGRPPMKGRRPALGRLAQGQPPALGQSPAQGQPPVQGRPPAWRLRH